MNYLIEKFFEEESFYPALIEETANNGLRIEYVEALECQIKYGIPSPTPDEVVNYCKQWVENNYERTKSL